MDLLKVQWLPVACGAVAWAVAIARVWFRFRESTPAQREHDFARWKATRGEPQATFEQFMSSDQVPRVYLSRASLCAVITALALLTLVEAMRRWDVFV